MATKIRRSIALPILGLDPSKPSEFLDPRSTPDCRNMRITRAIVEKRPGTSAIGDSLGERVMAIGELDTGGQTYLVRIGPTKVHLLNKATGVWSSIANTALTGSVSYPVSIAYPEISGVRVMVFTNGKDAIRKFTGTGSDADLGGTPPLSKYLIAWKGLLLLLNVTDGGNVFGTRVQWCDIGNIESWTPGAGSSAGSINLLDDSLDITGGGVWGDYPTVHKENCIYVVYPSLSTAVLQFERKPTGIGTIANGSIQSLPTGEQIFLAKDGIHTFNGASAPLLETPANEELRESINPENYHKIWSVIVTEWDEYWIGIPIGGDTEPDTVYKVNYRTGQVHRDYRPGISAIGNYKNTVETVIDDMTGAIDSYSGLFDDVTNLTLHKLQMFGTNAGITVKRDNVFGDNGTAIDAYWSSKSLTAVDFGVQGYDEDTLVRWQEIRLWAKGNAVTVEYSINDGYSWVTVGTYTLDSVYPTDAAPIRCFLDVVSTRFMVRFSNATLNQYFAFKQFKVYGVPREER